MIKQITLKKGGLARWNDSSPFILTEDFCCRIDGITAVNGNYYAVVENAGNKYKFALTDGTFTISKDWLAVGILNVSVLYYLKGALQTEYTAEPLVIKDVDGALSAEPVITDLQRQINKLNAEMTEYRTRVQKEMQELAKVIADLRRRVELMEADYDILKV